MLQCFAHLKTMIIKVKHEEFHANIKTMHLLENVSTCSNESEKNEKEEEEDNSRRNEKK